MRACSDPASAPTRLRAAPGGASQPSIPPRCPGWGYRERAATVECVNGTAKEHRGLRAVRVRGLGKVLGVALLFAVTHNILRYVALTG